MMLRSVPRLSRTNVFSPKPTPPRHRNSYSGANISDRATSAEINATSLSDVASSSAASPPTPSSDDSASMKSGLPTMYSPDSRNRPTYTSPPFHTHLFFKALEKTFPEETARSLMRATRALLVDRIGRIRKEALTAKDLDNVLDVLVLCLIWWLTWM